MLFAILALVTISVAVLLGFYLWRVPESALCPRCGRPTQAEPPDGSALRWNWPVEQLTAAAACPHCGWHGRTRRAPQAQAVRSGPGAGKAGR